jgi:transcriptional regulator with XRE-family HTH domain
VHDRMTFAALLWAAMGAAGLTRAELARRAKVGRAAVGKWVGGVADGPDRRRVLPDDGTLARILGVFPEDTGEQLRAAYLRERGLDGPNV